jgi:hypothetical protein
MNWQEIIKALITLPQENKGEWINILSSEETTTQFMRRLSNSRYQTRGINATVRFLKDDDSEQNLENYSSIEFDEEEIIRRYREHRPTMLRLLTNKLNRIAGGSSRSGKEYGENVRIENDRQLFSSFDELVEDAPVNVKLNSNWGRKLLALEEALGSKKILLRNKSNLLSKYNDFFSNWLIPGAVPPSTIATGKTIVGADGIKRPEYKVSPEYEKDWWDSNGRKLTKLFKLFGRSEQQHISYRANTLDGPLAAEYYSVAKFNRKLMPDDLLESDLLEGIGKENRLNINILHLLKEDSPLDTILEAASERLGQNVSDDEYAGQQAREVSGKSPLVFREEYIEKKRDDLADYIDADNPKNKNKILILDAFFNNAELEPFTHIAQVKVGDSRKEVSQNYVRVSNIDRNLGRNMYSMYLQEIKGAIDEDKEDYEIDDVLLGNLEIQTDVPVQETIDSIDFESLDANPTDNLTLVDFLNALKEADEALDINVFSDIKSVEKTIELVKTQLIEITQEKVDDIINVPTDYVRIKPIRGKSLLAVEGTENIRQSRKEVTFMSLLELKNIIEEVNE